VPQTEPLTEAPENPQFREVARWLGAGLAVPLIVLIYVAVQDEFPIQDMLSDPAETQGFDPLIGIVSTFGIFGWFVAAGATFLAWCVCRVGWFAAMCTLSAVMGVDDALLLHDSIFPERFGINEKLVLAGYCVLALAVVVIYRREFVSNLPGLLVIIVMLFVLSLAMDRHGVREILRLNGERYDIAAFIEDGGKLLGIWAWVTYVMIAATRRLARSGGGSL
jgi:hypothetical protein